MRGDDAKQEAVFSYLSPEKRVPAEHPAGLIVSHSTKRRVCLKAKSSLVLFAILLTSGCYVGPSARLYPVQGPLSAQKPVPVIIARVLDGNPGYISVVLGNGEVCKGRWWLTTATPANSMSTIWDTVYGPGYYVAHILGEFHGQSVVSCNRGTVLNVDMTIDIARHLVTETDGSAGEVRTNIFMNGVAKDSDGNVYKMFFYQQYPS